MWAQEWNNIYDDLLDPYPEASRRSTSARRSRRRRWDAVKMVSSAESFFTSLGFDPLPKTFWERSHLHAPARPRGRLPRERLGRDLERDLRVKMCIEPTEEDLVTIHHELGHDFYFHATTSCRSSSSDGANDGFHEAIGDTIALSA